MTEELEKEARFYTKGWKEQENCVQAYLAGAEPREKRIAELEAQIEKMKCGGNCKHLYHVNTGGCYDAKCDLTYCDCINCKDEWELRR